MWKHMPRVDIITNVIYANQHYALTLMQMFNCQRRSWKLSFLSPNPPPPASPAKALWRACSLAICLVAGPLTWGEILGFWGMMLMKCDNNKNFTGDIDLCSFNFFVSFFNWVNLSELLA